MPGGAPQELVIEGGARRTAWTSLTELWGARAVVAAFASRSVRVRYRQAVLGVVWVAAQPLALLVPFAVFLQDDEQPAGGVPYAASTLAALVAWQYLSSAVGIGSGAIVSEAVLVRKTWFPREAPVVAAVGVALVELAIGLATYAVAGPLLGAQLGPGLVAVPVVAMALVVVALALVLPLAGLDALYRDVRHAIPFVLLFWLFVSPVVRPVAAVAPQRQWLYAVLNPAVGPIEGMRRTLSAGTWPDWDLLGLSVLSAVVLGGFGHRWFRRLAPDLPDVV